MAKATQTTLEFPENEIRNISLNQIEPDKNQLRKEFKEDDLEALAESIKHDGQVQPILVTKGDDSKSYKIVDGERRWRALKNIAESQTGVPSTIKAIYVDKDNQLLGVLGNIARDSYNPMEMADALDVVKKMLGEDASTQDIANRIGKARNTVSEYNSLLKLPEEIRNKARYDSCVPFRRLKVLATKKQSKSEMITEYNNLHDEYFKKREKKKREDVKNKKSKPVQSMATKSIVSIHKKLNVMNSALESLQVKGKLEPKEKDNLLKSLQEIIATAKGVLERLSE